MTNNNENEAIGTDKQSEGVTQIQNLRSKRYALQDQLEVAMHKDQVELAWKIQDQLDAQWEIVLSHCDCEQGKHFIGGAPGMYSHFCQGMEDALNGVGSQ